MAVPHREPVCNNYCKMLYTVASPHRWTLHGHRELSGSASCTFTASYWSGPVGSLANLPQPNSHPLPYLVSLPSAPSVSCSTGTNPGPKLSSRCPSSSLSNRKSTFTLLPHWNPGCRRGWAALTWAGPMSSGLLPDSRECALVGEHGIRSFSDCPCLCIPWPKHWSTKHLFDVPQLILSFICISS